MWNNIKTFFQKAFVDQPEQPIEEVVSPKENVKETPKKAPKKKTPSSKKKEIPTSKPGSTSVIKRLKNQ